MPSLAGCSKSQLSDVYKWPMKAIFTPVMLCIWLKHYKEKDQIPWPHFQNIIRFFVPFTAVFLPPICNLQLIPKNVQLLIIIFHFYYINQCWVHFHVMKRFLTIFFIFNILTLICFIKYTITWPHFNFFILTNPIFLDKWWEHDIIILIYYGQVLLSSYLPHKEYN